MDRWEKALTQTVTAVFLFAWAIVLSVVWAFAMVVLAAVTVYIDLDKRYHIWRTKRLAMRMLNQARRNGRIPPGVTFRVVDRDTSDDQTRNR